MGWSEQMIKLDFCAVEDKASEIIVTSEADADDKGPEYWEKRLEKWRKLLHGEEVVDN
jgi:hypothetical protein